MRKHIVAGNWKLNKNLAEAQDLARSLTSLLADQPAPNVTVIVGPPAVLLHPVVEATSGGPVQVAAQNCSEHKSGAYTGETAASMIQSVGAGYVILGHSERRQYYGETNATVADKIDRAFEFGLQVIFCCGETLEERKAERHFEVVKTQLIEALGHLSNTDIARVVVAYEPVWAIGTGETASPAQAQEMHAHLRSELAAQFNQDIANATSILYGGSCKAANAQELFACPDIDGGLIGGASLNANDFHAIIQSF